MDPITLIGLLYVYLFRSYSKNDKLRSENDSLSSAVSELHEIVARNQLIAARHSREIKSVLKSLKSSHADKDELEAHVRELIERIKKQSPS